MKGAIRRLVGFLTRTTLRVGVLIAVVTLSIALNITTFAVDSVRGAIFETLERLPEVIDPDRPRKPTKDEQLRQLRQENADLEHRNANLDRRNADLDIDNRELQRARNAISTDLADERALRRAITEKGTDITRRMTQRTSRSITANFGSMAAEAVPYFGIAVVIGVTFYEVRDACLTMSDMRELGNMFGAPSDTSNRYCGFTLQEFKAAVLGSGSEVDCSSLNMPPEMVDECERPPTIDGDTDPDADQILPPPPP